MLPVFLWLVFSIMEIGHLAFRSILVHHAAYEVARYGSLTCFNTVEPSQSCEEPQPNTPAMQGVAKKILPGSVLEVGMRPTIADPQAGCQNYDIVVTIRQKVPMIFPMTSFWLGDGKRSDKNCPPLGGQGRTVCASVPMPVERPLFK